MTAFAIRSTTNHRDRRPGVLSRILETLSIWHDRHVQRGELARLSEYQLRDIGLSQSLVYREIEKPFWQA
jgi:uncharacterized protein YjiS (DUF1127 family)